MLNLISSINFLIIFAALYIVQLYLDLSRNTLIIFYHLSIPCHLSFPMSSLTVQFTRLYILKRVIESKLVVKKNSNNDQTINAARFSRLINDDKSRGSLYRQYVAIMLMESRLMSARVWE